MPMIGRKTNGGFEMTSRPLIVAAGVEPDVRAALASGVGEGDSPGVGLGDGVGVGASRVKLAHGDGGTLAHNLWTPG